MTDLHPHQHHHSNLDGHTLRNGSTNDVDSSEGTPLEHHPAASASAPTDETAEGVEHTFDPDVPVLVSIRWKDAESQGGPTWEDTDDMLEFARRPLTEVLTVGVLLHMDHEQIAVTDTVALDQVGGVTKIPRGWVERIDVLGPVPGDLIDVRPPDTDSEPETGGLDDRDESDHRPHRPRRVG